MNLIVKFNVNFIENCEIFAFYSQTCYKNHLLQLLNSNCQYVPCEYARSLMNSSTPVSLLSVNMI